MSYSVPSPVPTSVGVLRTLRGRLTLLACLATLPAFLFVLFVATQERRAALHRAESEARYVASLASREHAHQVIGAKRLLERLGGGGSGAATPGLPDQTLPTVLSAMPQFANLGILTTEGRLRFSVVAPDHSVDMRENAAFRAALGSGKVEVGRYQVGPIVGRPVLILAKAIRAPGGTIESVLFAALDLAWLDQLARQAQLPPDCAMFILDREGRVLARSQGSGRLVAEEGDALQGSTEITRGLPGMVRIVGRDGLPRLFTGAPMDGVPDLSVAVGLPEEAVIGAANRAFTRAVWALAVLTLLTVASSILAADLSVLRDARLLARATRRFGGGDLGARAPVPTVRGEIQDMALAFNTMADTLERKHQEAQEAEAGMRALSGRLHAIREEEGERISRELHDQLGQELTALKLELAQVKRKLQVACPPTAAGEVGEALDLIGVQIDACVESVRRISSELRPSVLDRLGLGPALEWLAREFERRTGLTCALSATEPTVGLPAATATALFRITQEALTNVARHAGGHAIRVDLGVEDGMITLEIQDDGRGFETRKQSLSLGLLGMRERARMVGGTLDIASGPGAGTIVKARVPLEAPQEPPC